MQWPNGALLRLSCKQNRIVLLQIVYLFIMGMNASRVSVQIVEKALIRF